MCLVTHRRTLTHEVHKTALTVLALLPTPREVNNSCFLKYIWALQLLPFPSPCLFLPFFPLCPLSPFPSPICCCCCFSHAHHLWLQKDFSATWEKWLSWNSHIASPAPVTLASRTRRWCSRAIQCVFCTVCDAWVASGVNKGEGETTQGY